MRFCKETIIEKELLFQTALKNKSGNKNLCFANIKFLITKVPETHLNQYILQAKSKNKAEEGVRGCLYEKTGPLSSSPNY